jgi:hypothetical protein
MKFLRIESSKFTPGIVLDPNHSMMEFFGFSLPENAIEFYEPVINWLNDLISEVKIDSKSHPEINVIFKLVYFNSSSLRQLLEIFHLFAIIHKLGVVLNITWQYDSEDPQMADSGKELGDLVKVPINVVAYN